MSFFAKFHGRRRWASAGVVAATAVATAGIALSAPPAGAAPGCRVDYTASNWGGGGFGGKVKITNLGDATSSWTMKFTFPGTQRATQGWSATWSQSGADVTAASMSWNGSLGTGASTEIGFNGSYTGSSNVDPSSFSLNGTVCTGQQPPTST